MEKSKRIIPKELWELTKDDFDYLYNSHTEIVETNGKREVAVGLSIGKIADMYETSDSNVTYRLRKFNIKKNAKLISSIKSDMIAKLYDLLLNHMSHEDIEKELRVDIRALILCDLTN